MKRTPATDAYGNTHYVPTEKTPTEDYGFNGDSEFCSQRCGYQWAVERIKMLREMVFGDRTFDAAEVIGEQGKVE